jgi:triosephosphate isomerase
MDPFFSAGGVLLKTIVRSNPGLVLLKDGEVIRKWPSTDLPTYKELNKGYLNEEAN